MSLWEAPKVTADMDIKQLRNLVAMLIDDLDFVINGNISSKNVREIGGFQVGQDYFRSRNAVVGLSSAVVGGLYDDVRFWAGSPNKEMARFRVHNSGKLVATGAEISGNIQMGPGSTIDWGGVGAPEYDQINGLKPPSNADNTTNAIGPQRLTKITSTGVYTGTVEAYQINTVNLAAEKIYQPGFPNNYAAIGGAYGDFVLHQGGNEFFRINHDLGGITQRYGPDRFLTSSGFATWAYGNWNFSNANVSGVTAKFA